MSSMVKGIIGGNEFLTEVLVRGLTVHGPAEAYCVGHCSDQLGMRLAAKCRVQYVKNITDLIPNSAILFLTFNPEDANNLLPRIAEKVKEWTLIVSAVHGLKIATLEYFFPNNEIIRLAVNPSIISGAGLGAYAGSQKASTDAKSMAEIVLKDCGDVIAVKDEKELEEIEKYLAANTFLSYVVIQTMIKNAKKIGMTSKEANFAVDKLLKGSMHTLIDEGYDTADLISRGLKDKSVHNEAVELIKSYGLDTEIMNSLKNPEPPVNPDENPNDDPKNYKMHYRWSR
ncbi:MAG: hypothetical protein IK062_05635 [Selenomonadaceae bacterium]|nr:hypothetical protein [Selenomonadaceae bacterium]